MASDTNRSVCAEALSSPYALLPRAHTYALVVALLAPLPRGWLFRAALAAFTTRTAIFAVDAAVLLGTLVRHHDDQPISPQLDVLVCLQSTTLAALVACWLLLVSRRGSESAARGLVRVWAVIVAIGCILAFAATLKLDQLVADAAPVLEENCHGVEIDTARVWGATTDVPALGRMGSKGAVFLKRVGIPGVIFAALAIMATAVPRSRSLPTAIRQQYSDYSTTEIVTDASGPSKLRTMASALHSMLMIILPAMIIFVMVTGEMYFQHADLPSVERMSSVGQWGVWVATGVVVLATLFNAVKDKVGLSNVEPNITAYNSTQHIEDNDEKFSVDV